MKDRFLFQFIANGTFSVDVFFVMSGFLLCFVLLKSLAKAKGVLRWGLVYFHRWWRLSPLYYFVVFYAAAVGDMMATGPLKGIFVMGKPCRQSWWSNLLYINNFTPRQQSLSCITWSWYLALDMQFFLLSVPIVYALFHKPLFGFATLTCLAVAGP